MAKVIPGDGKNEVKMKGKKRTGYVIIDNEGLRLGMIGEIPGEGLRLFFERNGFKSYEQIRQNLIDVANAIPVKPKTAL